MTISPIYTAPLMAWLAASQSRRRPAYESVVYDHILRFSPFFCIADTLEVAIYLCMYRLDGICLTNAAQLLLGLRTRRDCLDIGKLQPRWLTMIFICAMLVELLRLGRTGEALFLTLCGWSYLFAYLIPQVLAWQAKQDHLPEVGFFGGRKPRGSSSRELAYWSEGHEIAHLRPVFFALATAAHLVWVTKITGIVSVHGNDWFLTTDIAEKRSAASLQGLHEALEPPTLWPLTRTAPASLQIVMIVTNILDLFLTIFPAYLGMIVYSCFAATVVLIWLPSLTGKVETLKGPIWSLAVSMLGMLFMMGSVFGLSMYLFTGQRSFLTSSWIYFVHSMLDPQANVGLRIAIIGLRKMGV